MLSPDELRLFDAVVDHILPAENGEAMRAYVRARAELQPDLYRTALIVLEANGFDRLGELEGHPSIAMIIQHAVEGYYTSPAGLAEVGFRVTA